uniref:FYVE-type domain-containing protein n=1 Tax=Globisporangium ultimum (strain ATCC 200006 / CBS 805.95 / DAOM BR144) TaxID=431595 RepID=K3X133_GLOUD
MVSDMYSSNGRRVPLIQLTPSEQSHYDAVVSDVLQAAIKEYAGFQGFIDTDDWAYVRRRKQMSVYRSLQPCDDPRATVMVGTGLIPGTLEDVMDGLYCDTTSELRGVKTFIKYKFLDGAVLNVSERRSPQAPFRFAGIKWTAATAAWGIAKNRDLLTYDRMGTITDRQGNELAYHVLTSINRPEWPANNIKGIQRTETTTCYLYRRHKHRVVQCFMWGKIYDINNSGPIVQRIAEYVAASTWLNVVRSVKCAEAKKYSNLLVDAKERSWQEASTVCQVCYKGASKFGSSHIKCAGCCENTCKSCSFSKKIFEIDAKTKKPTKERFCKLCMNKALSKSAVV